MRIVIVAVLYNCDCDRPICVNVSGSQQRLISWRRKFKLLQKFLLRTSRCDVTELCFGLSNASDYSQ